MSPCTIIFSKYFFPISLPSSKVSNLRLRNFRRQKKPLEINEWSDNKDGSGPSGPSSSGGGAISGAESINVTGDIKMDIDLNKELAAAADVENANPKN